MQHISKIISTYRIPLNELIAKYENITIEELKSLTPWERSTYRQVIKFSNKDTK